MNPNTMPLETVDKNPELEVPALSAWSVNSALTVPQTQPHHLSS